MKLNGKVFALAFAVTMAAYSIAWALTVSQIYNRIYDAANTAIRVNRVAG